MRAVQERERDRGVRGEREKRREGGRGERDGPRFGKPVISDVPSQRGEQSLLGEQPGGR